MDQRVSTPEYEAVTRATVIRKSTAPPQSSNVHLPSISSSFISTPVDREPRHALPDGDLFESANRSNMEKGQPILFHPLVRPPAGPSALADSIKTKDVADSVIEKTRAQQYDYTPCS